MSKPEKVSIVRFKKQNLTFEIPTKPGSVKLYREGKMSKEDVLLSESIFTNFHKTDRARTQDLETAFGTTDMDECLEIMLNEGTYQETAKEKREETEKKRKNLIHLINKNYIDPKTKTHHPTDRIDNALKEVKFRVDQNKEASQQVEAAVEKLHGYLSLKKMSSEATLTIKLSYVGAVMNLIHAKAKILKEDYEKDVVKYQLDISPMDIDDFMSGLNKVTKGDYKWVSDQTADGGMILNKKIE